MNATSPSLALIDGRDFVDCRRQGVVCADKTAWISVIDGLHAKFIRLLRPPRFGKSFFLSMLLAYCDCAQQEDFASNFCGTSLGAHSTSLQGQYFILKIDGVGRCADAARRLAVVKAALEDFLNRYQIEGRDAFLSQSFLSAADCLNGFCHTFRRTFAGKVFLLIDDYEPAVGEAVPSASRPGGNGNLGSFYAVVKKFAGRVFDRICLVGVTPVSFDDVVTGFNIATDYSADPRFAEAFGFTEAELRRVIRETMDLAALQSTEDELVARMKALCGGYRFSRDSDTTVFHPALSMAYLRFLAEQQREPQADEVLDASLAEALELLRSIWLRSDANFLRSVADQCGQGLSVPALEFCRNIKAHSMLDRSDVLTALFSLGLLTWSPGKEKALVCPNQISQTQVFEVLASFNQGEVK